MTSDADESESSSTVSEFSNTVNSVDESTTQSDSSADQESVDEVRKELKELEDRIDSRTLHRDEIEQSLKRYVRKQQRRGHARGWGPYLVFLYGTAMTVGAFYFLSGGWAILAMLVIWLSTLGLYVFMVVVGIGLSLLETPGKLIDWIGSRKD